MCYLLFTIETIETSNIKKFDQLDISFALYMYTILLLLTNVQCSTLWNGDEIAGFQIPTTIRLTNHSSQQIKDYKYTAN